MLAGRQSTLPSRIGRHDDRTGTVRPVGGGTDTREMASHRGEQSRIFERIAGRSARHGRPLTVTRRPMTARATAGSVDTIGRDTSWTESIPTRKTPPESPTPTLADARESNRSPGQDRHERAARPGSKSERWPSRRAPQWPARGGWRVAATAPQTVIGSTHRGRAPAAAATATPRPGPETHKAI